MPAWAARVVDVRMGQHAGFSRVVFELDSPVGYKVERNAPEGGGSELVVSFDAAADAKTLTGKLDYIKKIEIKSDGRRSTARMSLVGSGLKLKEMILANPPRIVLDVLDEGARKAADSAAKAAALKKSQAAAKAKAKAEQAARAAKAAEAEKVASAADSAASTVTSPSAAPSKEQAGAMEGVQSPASMADSSASPSLATPGKPARLAMNGSPAPAAALPARQAPPAMGAPTAKPALTPPAKTAPGTAPGATAKPAPKPAATARPKRAPAAPPAAVVPPADTGLFTTTNVLGALGFVLLAGAGTVLWRRRSSNQGMDPSEFDAAMEQDNPFASAETVTAEAEDDDEIVAPTSFDLTSDAVEGIAVPETDTSSIIDAPLATASEGAEMPIATDIATDGNTTTLMPPPSVAPMGATSGDSAQMMAELERRLGGMETRIDELVDSKERLERQVAAQTEELRVQRAAIARTQRAVRNLNRPGDDSPTEPALRDPTRPEGPRG